MYSNILIPISKDSNMSVIVDFLNNFLNPDGEITLLYIITSDKLPISAVEWRRAMGVISQAQVLSIERGLEVNYLVKNARSAVQGILEEASEAKYDLIFFANSTYGKRRENIFGSKIDEVVRRSATETVVLRYVKDEPVKYSKVLVPTSGYKNALRAVRMAEVLAARGKGEVAIMYVGPRKSDADKVLGPLAEDIEKKGVKARKLYVKGTPAEAILEEARKGYDLMMIGATERPYYYQFLLGSTADRLVREAPCPVLMVKTRGPFIK
jgi:nucleotide-binding universal stress UspA family protein